MGNKSNLNKEFGESMDKGIANLVENHEFHKATNTVVFNADQLNLPDGVTKDSLATHMTFLNDTSLQVEAATSQLARKYHEENKDLTRLDSALNFGSGVSVNSIHNLRQQTGKEEYIYGHGTTAVDFHHNQQQADWLASNRASDQELAAKLFG